MIFYDFEVFKCDWLVVLIDTDSQKETVIINDSDELKEFYQNHKNDVWVGYNSNGYDRYILKAILCDFSPAEMNDWIIVQRKKGWEFSALLNKIPLLSYDTQISKLRSLKQLEAFMGHDIRETTVSFQTNRKLTDDEIEEVVFYCRHDVHETIEVFMLQIEEFQSQLALINEFQLNINNISKTKPQLSARILNANPINHNDEMDITIVDTIQLSKYDYVRNWYENNRDYSKTLQTMIADVPHVFAWGGLHGAIKNYHEKGFFINMDVASMYPAIMIEYDFLSRNVANKEKYRKIRDVRLELKAKKDKRQAPYKIVLNSTYGASKDKHNALFDPLQANNVCINGQLLLLDLIEKLEPYCQIIQSNTDGILIKCQREDFNLIDDISHEWEERTGLILEFDYFREIHQKDVNNYIMIPTGKLHDENGKPRWKSKGSYVKKLNRLDYDLPIVNEAVVNYFVKNITVEQTINTCNELIKFQKIVKISSKYEFATHGRVKRHEKVFRVFADKDGKQLMKCRDGKTTKIANVPELCRIINTNIVNENVPRWLDKNWYIQLAKKRIKDFIGE